MARTSKTTWGEAAREANTEAQQAVAARRKESGLELLKLYLDTDTVIALEHIASELGYRSPEPKTKKRIETLSECVTYCVKKLNADVDDVYPKTHFALEYNRLYQIAQYRKHECNEEPEDIADFFNEWGFLNARDLFRCRRKGEDLFQVKATRWTPNHVKRLLDKDRHQEQLERLNSSTSQPS